MSKSNAHLNSDQMSREQYRFAFAAAVLGTYFLIPSNNLIEQYIRYVFLVAAFFASVYLLASAAALKYFSRNWMYSYLYASVWVRYKAYDLAIDTFAGAVLLFLSMVLVGFVENALHLHLGDWMTALAVSLVAIIFGLVMLAIGSRLERKEAHKLDELIKRI